VAGEEKEKFMPAGRELLGVELKAPEPLRIQWPDFGKILSDFIDRVKEAFRGFIDFIAEGIAKFWERAIPAREAIPKEIASSLTTTTPDWAKPLINELTHHYLKQVKTVTRSLIAINPYIDRNAEDAVYDKVASIIIPAASTVIATAVATQLAEIVHPLRELRVSEMTRAILEAMGVFALVNAVWNLIYMESLIQPLKYELNYVVRPWLPPQSIVDTMLFQEGIGERAWEEYYRKIGWSEEWINAWRKARHRPPSPFLLYRLMENPNIPARWYDKVLRYHGLDKEDVEILKEAFKWYALKDEIYKYRDAVVYWYRKGLINTARLYSELSALPLSKDVIEWTASLAKLHREMEIREDLISAIREGFRKGKITELEYVNQLRALDVEDPVIAGWLEVDKVKRKVELRKTVVSLEEVG